MKQGNRHYPASGPGAVEAILRVMALSLLVSGCSSIWNAGDLEVWVRDRAADQGCQRETIQLEMWYVETAAGNVWRGTCLDVLGQNRSFGINVDPVWTPSKSADKES